MGKGHVLVALTAASLTIGFGAAEASARPSVPYETLLVTRNITGGLPNGSSQDPAISQDQMRDASVLAFDSYASDLVHGDTNGLRDVFIVRRAEPFDNNGSRWIPGATELISRGLNGAPANGASYMPKVDGSTDNFRRPRCVAFLSDASNLVHGDSNGATDAFAYVFATHRIVRISLASGGRQANGPTRAVAVDGTCTRIAFVSDASDLGAHGHWQVFERDLLASPNHYRKAALRNRTLLVSRGRGGAGNGDSNDPSFVDRTFSGELAFDSTSSNLPGRSSTSQIYYFDGHRVRLVSATRRGQPGTGPSIQPSPSEKGDWIAYATRATNLVGSVGGHQQIVRATNVRGARRTYWVSRDSAGIGNGDSADPMMANNGWYTAFDTVATNRHPFSYGGNDSNGVSDVYLYTAVRQLDLAESRRSDDQSLGQLPALHPSVSPRANYMFFESSDPFMDMPFVRAHFLGTWLRDAWATLRAASQDPRFHQIYMHWLGPV